MGKFDLDKELGLDLATLRKGVSAKDLQYKGKGVTFNKASLRWADDINYGMEGSKLWTHPATVTEVRKAFRTYISSRKCELSVLIEEEAKGAGVKKIYELVGTERYVSCANQYKKKRGGWADWLETDESEMLVEAVLLLRGVMTKPKLLLDD
jgi:hypothetical protein